MKDGTDAQDRRRRGRRPRPSRRLPQPLGQVRTMLGSGFGKVLKVVPTPLRKPWVGAAIVVVVGMSAGGLYLGYTKLQRELPDISTMEAFVRPGTLTIKAVDGSILLQNGPATREKISIRQMPKTLVNAFIASEDRRFYQHGGVDYWGIFRATARNLVSGDAVEGASTITQQLARMVFLNQDLSLIRKIREAMLAQKLEHEFSKDQILEKYLNLVYLGSEAYGVADAAWVYFSKPVQDLTLSESAMIAGLPPAPSLYSPLVDPQKAKQRRDIVLDRMAEQGYITQSQADAAKAEPIKLKPATPKHLYSASPYFTAYVQQELAKRVPKEAIEYGGLTVETTLNPQWQTAADSAVKDAIKLDGPGQGFSQAALVAIDPRNGEIRAMVGGYDYYKESQFNRATQAQRQPGSTFKTFLYTTAIAAGFSPYRGYMDERYVVDGYEPRNYNNKYYGYVDMRTALSKSLNVVSVKILQDVGFEPAIKMAHAMGIHSPIKETYSLALGAYEVNLLELTSGYGTLAAQGEHVDPHGILRVTDNQGKELYNANFKAQKVLDPGTVSIVTWMLENVVKKGTGQAAALSDRPVAGKTGTSEEARDLWFVGFVPQLVTGVWLGNDDNSPTYGSSGTAAYTWGQFMQKVAKDLPVEKFPELPKNLDSRKGSIKAKPIQPKTTYSKGTAPDPKDSGSWRDRSSELDTPSRPHNPSVDTESRSDRPQRKDSDSAPPPPPAATPAPSPATPPSPPAVVSPAPVAPPPAPPVAPPPATPVAPPADPKPPAEVDPLPPAVR